VATEYIKPIPVPSPESEPFWAAAREHELKLQRCSACDHTWFPPSDICPECMSNRWTWKTVSGKGTIFSFVIFHRPYHPGFRDELPYNVSIIELEEGPRMYSNVVGCSNEDLHVGMPVKVVFDDVTDEVTLPKFQPA
jgi:uncharacterized protein